MLKLKFLIGHHNTEFLPSTFLLCDRLPLSSLNMWGSDPPRLLSVQTYTQTQTAAAQTLELQGNMIQHPWLNASFSKNSSCPLAFPLSAHQLRASTDCITKWGATFKFLCLDLKLNSVLFWGLLKGMNPQRPPYSSGPGVTLKWCVRGWKCLRGPLPEALFDESFTVIS